MQTISVEILASIVGGREQVPANYQNNLIGVQVGDAKVGLSEEGGRSDYGICLNDAMNRNFTPKQIKQTCGKPPAPTTAAPTTGTP